MDEMKKKLNEHNSKVDKVRTHMSSEEKKRIENKKEKMLKKMDAAKHKREQILEQVKNVAQLSAKKKQNGGQQNLAPSPIETLWKNVFSKCSL